MEKPNRLIASISFDAITTFEEFQKIIYALLKQGFNLEIIHSPEEWSPLYSSWTIVVTKE